MLGFSVSNEALKVFIAELGEQLERLEVLIVKLEKSAGPEIIQELFRITHTIKGSAASIGHDKMAELAHAMESILDAVRCERLKVSSKLTDALILSLDALKAFENSLQTGEISAVEVKDLVSMLESLSAGGSGSVVEVIVSLSPNCGMPAGRAFQSLMALKKMGEIIHSKPSVEELKKETPILTTFIVHLKTVETIETIEKALSDVQEISGLSIHELESKNNPGGDLTSEPKPGGELKSIRTVRVNVELFDQLMNLVGELVIGKTRLMQIGSEMMEKEEAPPITEELLDGMRQFGKIIVDLQSEVMKARLLPIEVVFSKFPRMMRDLSLKSGKDIDFVMEGEETQLDRSVIEEISDPIVHLLRNAVDHGIEPPDVRRRLGKSETGRIKLKAHHQENHVVIEIEDDGAGIDLNKVRDVAVKHGIITSEKARTLGRNECMNLIFSPGFSTASKVSDVSGRGVGLDIVKQKIQKIGGAVSVTTEVGTGTLFNVRLPFSLAIVQALQVTVKDRTFAIPISCVVEIVRVESDQVKTIGKREVLNSRGGVIPLVWLGESYGEPFPSKKSRYNIVVVMADRKSVGIAVDGVHGSHQFVTKTMGSYIGDLPGISGATVLADGSVGLILDVGSFISSVEKMRERGMVCQTV